MTNIAQQYDQISIHAPREGSDELLREGKNRECISIHAPREGSDVGGRGCTYWLTDFNPRSP